MSALSVPSRSKYNGPSGSGCHGVVMISVNLGVCSEFDATVLLVVDLLASDNGPWAVCVTDAVVRREAV